jgi:hypothetical protein
MQPPPLCFPESGVPAEQQPLTEEQSIDLAADRELCWQPDYRPPGHLDAEEALKLEKRGITPQTEHPPRPIWKTSVQSEFWRTQTAHKNSIAAKLREAGMELEANKLETCHTDYTFAVCGDCGTIRKFPNRCDLFYCPECQPGLARDRKRQVEWWVKTIKQPKHVVLTVKNISNLEPGHLDELRRWFTRLRRRKFASNWRGGFYSIELTNEGAGWHLHLHALIDCRFIDGGELALQWANITRNAGRIVKVKDCRQHDYLSEVTKYAVKGTQLAAWQPAQVAEFIRAFDGKRTFGVFGELYGMRTEFREWIEQLRLARPRCDCGSCNVRYFDSAKMLELDLQPTIPTKPKPPQPLFTNCELPIALPRLHD